MNTHSIQGYSGYIKHIFYKVTRKTALYCTVMYATRTFGILHLLSPPMAGISMILPMTGIFVFLKLNYYLIETFLVICLW